MMPNPLEFEPDECILVNRVYEANKVVQDAIKEWKHFLSLEDKEPFYAKDWSNPHRAYFQCAQDDFRTIANGAAALQSFEVWFNEDDLVKKADDKVINMMLSNGTISDKTPKLTNTLKIIVNTADYLAKHAMTIASDPFFSKVRDRSSSNFLWFIKFERDFKEAEKKLDLTPNCDILPNGHTAQIIPFKRRDHD